MATLDSATEHQIANPNNLPLQSDFALNPADNQTGYRSFKAGSFEFRL